MEIFVSRQEIRRRVLARLGNVTNGAQAPLVNEQYNEFIRSAAEAVAMRCPWQQSMRETFVSVGIDQRLINYPAQTGPGNIQAIGLWDEGSQTYTQLRRGKIPVVLDDEPLVALGEPDSIPGRAQPERYELRSQIEIWPRPDQAYQLKIDHTIHPQMADDNDVSVVDAECIILWAMADAYDFQGDAALAQVQRGKFEERIRLLMANQSPMEQIRRGGLDRLRMSRRRDEYVPDSGLWPSRMPS